MTVMTETPEAHLAWLLGHPEAVELPAELVDQWHENQDVA